MTRIAVVLIGVLAVSTSAARAQTREETIEKATAAAPRQLKDGAMVIAWKADGTYETLREGTNRLLCFDRSGAPAQQAFAVQCTSVANLERVKQNRKFEEIADRAARQAAVAAAEKDGTRVKPEFGSVWYDMSGADRASARIHVTIAVPGATAQSLGIPDNPKMNGAWLMDAGTSGAHIMTPGS